MPPFKPFMLVRDNFYSDPDKVAAFARGLDYHGINVATGYRSNKLYQEAGMKRRFEKMLTMKITHWGTHINSENGIFFYAFSAGRLREKPAIHTDTPVNDVTAVVYLTKDLPRDCGTSFWKHKKTGISQSPTRTDAKRLGTDLKNLKQQLENDALRRSAWMETDRIGYQFNRMIAFPSGVFHSATNHFGDHAANGRIIQTFRIGVNWTQLD